MAFCIGYKTNKEIKVSRTENPKIVPTTMVWRLHCITTMAIYSRIMAFGQ